MGKRELGGGNFEVVPIIGISEKPGVKFVGKLLDKGQEVKAGMGTKWLYTFELHDTDANVVVKNDKDGYDEVDVKQYDKVCIFATALLNRKLSMANVGEIIEIEYTGKDRGKKGQSYHNFIVSVIEE